jgi:type I restriction enzyme S subunit
MTLNSFFKTPFPPIQEQTTIAAFLDCETAKIDNLINEQKKLIELLKEKRQAVISTAVTKGLNPHAPMKDSGVEWLGEVPQGWEVKPIKKLGHIVSGYAFPSSDFVKEGEIRVLKISNIQTGYLDWSDESYLPKSSYIDNFSVKNGDIIFALTRPIISTGIKAAVASIGEGEIVLLNQRNALFRPFPIAERKFLYYILFDYNFKAAFENCIDSTGQQPNISPIDIGNIFVAVPTINEQSTIVAFLDQETAKIDNLIQQAQKATTLLQERRTALISAAVTGKIDVRNKSLPASL